MQVFISWSGRASQDLALSLRDWLPTVVQAVRPYVSSEDIDKGARWSVDLFQILEQSNFGILCITPENVAAPWLNFEAGALSKSLETARVSPFLLDVEKSDIVGPLAQFQATAYEPSDVLRLVRGINAAVEQPVERTVLERIFAKMWPELQAAVDPIRRRPRAENKGTVATRTDRQILDEILETVRTLTRNAAQSTGGEAPGTPLAGVDDAVLDDLVGIWSEALLVSEDSSLPDEDRAAACHEWLILLSAPILKEIRLHGSSVIAKHDREIERVYRRLITGKPDDFPRISASRWGAFLDS